MYAIQMAVSLKLLSVLENSQIYTSDSLEVKEVLKSLARQNFFINSVTALENFLRYWIVKLFYIEQMIHKKTNETKAFLNWKGISELLELKGTLELLIQERDKEENDKITNPSLYIISTYSFQNLNDINFVMGKITGRNFFEGVENKETEFTRDPESKFVKNLIDDYTKGSRQSNLDKSGYFNHSDWTSQLIDLHKRLLEKQGKFILKKKYPNWKEKIGLLFELRNEFVHYISSKELSQDEVSEFLMVLYYFVRAVDAFLVDEILGPMYDELEDDEIPQDENEESDQS